MKKPLNKEGGRVKATKREFSRRELIQQITRENRAYFEELDKTEAKSTPPYFTAEPEPLSVRQGDPVLLRTRAEGQPTPTYQWYELNRLGRRIRLVGETRQQLELANLPPGIFHYSVRARNGTGDVFSKIVEVSVSAAVGNLPAPSPKEAAVKIQEKIPPAEGSPSKPTPEGGVGRIPLRGPNGDGKQLEASPRSTPELKAKYVRSPTPANLIGRWSYRKAPTQRPSLVSMAKIGFQCVAVIVLLYVSVFTNKVSQAFNHLRAAMAAPTAGQSAAVADSPDVTTTLDNDSGGVQGFWVMHFGEDIARSKGISLTSIALTDNGRAIGGHADGLDSNAESIEGLRTGNQIEFKCALRSALGRQDLYSLQFSGTMSAGTLSGEVAIQDETSPKWPDSHSIISWHASPR